MAKKLIPLGKKVVIQRLKAEDKFPGSNLFKPDSAKKKEPSGIIIAVGPGTTETKMVVEVGWTVLFNDYGYAPHPDMPDICCVSQDDIIARVVDE